MNRTERAAHSRRKRRAPLALFVVPIVLIALGVGLVLFLTGNADVIEGVIPGGDDPEPVPEFDFKLSKVFVVGTAEDADQVALRPDAEATAQEIVPILSDLFTASFLDPNNWKDGDYASAFDLYSEAALPQAQTQGAETLTLGEDAGDTYADVQPRKGSVRFDVLFDREGAPFSVAAKVRFYATAELKDSTFVSIVSHGVLFLEQNGDGWEITAYDMKRNDRETEAPTATGATGAATSTTGATGGS